MEIMIRMMMRRIRANIYYTLPVCHPLVGNVDSDSLSHTAYLSLYVH